MPSGGARARSGPPPDLNSLRRDRDKAGEWLVLPSEGRTRPAPVWPLEMVTDRELSLWTALWCKPVALLWERDQLAEQVALYVRNFVEAEKIGAPAANRTLARQMAGELLLTIPAMLSARVRIATDELETKRGEAKTPVRKSAKDRMKVVPGGQGA